MGDLTLTFCIFQTFHNEHISIGYFHNGGGGGEVHTGDTGHLVLGGSETDVVLRNYSVLAPP